MSGHLLAVRGVIFPELRPMMLSSVSRGMRCPITTPTVSSHAYTAPSQTFSHQHDSSRGSEHHFDPAQATDGRLVTASTAFRMLRSLVPLESETP